MLAAARKIARREQRTMSGLVREALRTYEHNSWWEETNAYGKAKAEALGLTEADVLPLVAEVRRSLRKHKK